jgi:DNA-binding transcriptional LysR family regulator
VGVGKADLGFVYDVAVDLSNITSEPLFKEDMSLVVHKDSPVTSYESAEAAGLRLVAFPPHYALRRMLHSSGINATYVAEVDTVDGMLQLVSTGVGDCILPSKLPCKLLSDYGLRKCPANNPALNRWVVAISRLDKPLPLLAKSFLDSAIQISQEFKN